MSKLDDLINELCPDGIEYAKIEDICDVSSGGDVPKNSFSQEKTLKNSIPIISNGIGENALYGYTDKPKITKPAVTVSARGTIGYAEYRDYPYYPIIRLLTAIPKNNLELDTKYLYYCLTKKIYKIPVSGIPQLTSPNFKKELIPVPPLEVQSEIVRVLDNFTEYNDLLQKELTLRKKQYEYYRDMLLNFDNSVEWQMLGEIATISRGIRVVKNDLQIEGYPVFQNSLSPMGYFSRWNRKANNTFIISAGAAGEIGYSYIEFWAADDCYTFECDEKLNNRFLYYLLMKNQYNIRKQVRKASIPRLARSAIEKLLIPVPPIEEQKRIVKILDRFDTLCNDLTSGIPAEISARKKQYEFYRDKLLQFRIKKA